MSDWETYAWRVTWLESPAFAGREPTRHERVVEYGEDVLDLLREISRRKPVTGRPTYHPEVVELQRRTETREKPCGLAGWSA